MSSPPRADKRPHSYTFHGITVEDPYNWLRDPSYPVVDDKEILAHVEAENAWYEQRMAPHKALTDTIFEELKGRVKEDDSTVPQKDGDWIYWSEYETGLEYSKHYRKPAAGGDADLLLDENELAKGKDYFSLGDFSISKNGKLLAYSYDDDGSERYLAKVKNLETGAHLTDEIEGVNSSLIWCANDTVIAYGRANEFWRVDNLRLHKLGTSADADVEIFREDFVGFEVAGGLSAEEDYLIIATGDNETSEIRFVKADNPAGPQTLVRAREKAVQYDIDIREGKLFVHSNRDHINFSLLTASLDKPGKWQTIIPGSDEFYLTSFSLFKNFFVTQGRIKGLDQVEIRQYKTPNKAENIRFPEESYSAGLSDNPEYDVTKLRLSYQSMVTPPSVFDYHLADKRMERLKIREIPSGYDASKYVTKRLYIKARDGAEVPVSIVMRKDRDSMNCCTPHALHIYAYGAYGSAIPPGFSTSRLSLLDRGMAYAIAHIRGGDDLGRHWYLQGKTEQRTNTFHDFEDVARGLLALGYADEGKISASGGSAGGELMGVIVNNAPELWGAVVADVPFVDVLNTMLDGTLPLTPGEWPEWGNPIESKAAFELLRSYSPYEQVEAKAYPPLMVTAGLNDPRVTYWEPLKWVARLRELKTNDKELILKTNMGAGHGGKSGRYSALYETAEEYTFLLWQLGLA